MFVQAGLDAGGAEKIVNLLANHYAQLGHEVVVLALSGVPVNSYFPYDPVIRLECYTQDGVRKIRSLRRMQEFFWLRTKFTELRPDVVVSFLTKVNLLSCLAARSAGFPIVISERNNPAIQHRNSPWRFANWITGLLANRLVMQTVRSVGSLPPYAKSKAVIIPNPSTKWDSVQVSRNTEPSFVAVGRLETQKGFDLLIHAFSKVVQEVPNATMTIFGEGPEQNKLTGLIENLGLEQKARLAGKTPKPGDWIHTGNIFVLSSRFEGFPNVLVEAMFAGFPVISFDCAWGPSEIIADRSSGLLIDDGDVAGLARAMTELATDPVLCTKLSAAAPGVVEHLSACRILAQWDQIVELYGSALKAGGRR